MHKVKLELDKYASLARQVAAEGCVLLKNDHQALPLKKDDKVAVFGRCAYYYYKSGLGSGGLVNTRYVVSIMDALLACEDITINQEVQEIYQAWIQENPVDEGHGWGTVPWSQKEMPVTDEVLEAAKSSSVAIVIVGRTAGEDQDNAEKEGSYLLTQTEEDMIRKVSERFERTIVILNVGNIVDMSWVEEYKPAAVLYAWQGGQEGGNAVVDVLTGKVNPSGKLTDTIAYGISDYPSTSNFGNLKKNYYQEDIYVGYRYFETFAKDAVQYPFGYGLSYTQFVMTSCIQNIGKDDITIAVMVKNVGAVAGKEVVQIYVEAPQGKLGKPVRVLVGFQKTKLLEPQEEQWLKVVVPKERYASFDDSGITGYKNSFLLEAGEYRIYVGRDVRSASLYGSYVQGTQVIEELEEACAPIEVFERFKPYAVGEGTYCVELEKVPIREVDIQERIKAQRTEVLEYTGDQGYCLGDVYSQKITLDEFVAQLSEDELLGLFYGEGMCSPKVTAGTAGAFGGVTEDLVKKGVPVACCADGPSGIRMDCGTKAFSLPNGTAIGCSFNLALTQELFEMVGAELWKQKIDTILGPGINIHRNPLNGRNFEYFSEDPLLTGLMCVAQLKGLHEAGATGTIKHFCANNQEQERCFVEAIVSQRALREIYLKVYELAVKEGNARSIMTSYGPTNGVWAAGNYDLCTTVLRKQWGYEGIVMTDWWATANWEGEEATKTNRAPMILAQNDIYMCCADAQKEMNADNVKEMLQTGVIQVADLQRNTKNILQFLLQSQSMLRLMGLVEEDEDALSEDTDDLDSIRFYEMDENGSVVLTQAEEDLTQDEIVVGIITDSDGEYFVEVEASSELGDLAQLGISLYMDNIYREMITFRGMNGGKTTQTCRLGYMLGRNHYVKIVRSAKGLDILKIKVYHEAR